MLDRLVRRAVFADADRVVREDVGADDELTAVEPRRHDELPRLVLEFRDTASRQAFLSELLAELKTPSTDRKPAWRHAMRWNCGGTLG